MRMVYMLLALSLGKTSSAKEIFAIVLEKSYCLASKHFKYNQVKCSLFWGVYSS